MYSRGHRTTLRMQGKADALEYAEGSRPGRAMASVEVITGVWVRSTPIVKTKY